MHVHVSLQNMYAFLKKKLLRKARKRPGGLIILTCSLWLNCKGHRSMLQSQSHIEWCLRLQLPYIPCLTMDHNLDLGVTVDFTEGGKPENPGKESMKENNYNSNLLTWVLSLRINMGLYPGGHPSSCNPVLPCLTQSSAVKCNLLTAYGIHTLVLP